MDSKMAFQLSLHSAGPEITREYPDGIEVQGYEVALKSFVAYNNIPNVSSRLNNNVLHLVKDVYSYVHRPNDDLVTTSEGQDYVILTRTDNPFEQEIKLDHQESREIVFDIGSYELKDIENVIFRDKGHAEHQTSMLVDYVTKRVGIKSKWALDMTHSCSIGSILGYERRVFPSSGDYIWSTRPIELFTVHNIRIKSNLTWCNIQDNSLHDSTLYEFPLAVGIAEKIIERPPNPEYYKIMNDKIQHLRLIVVDQNDRLIDFMGEKISILLHFRPALY